MDTWLDIGLSNAAAASVLAVLVWLLSLTRPRPALRHALWTLVLLKLVTPPLAWLPVLPGPEPARADISAEDGVLPAGAEPIPDLMLEPTRNELKVPDPAALVGFVEHQPLPDAAAEQRPLAQSAMPARSPVAWGWRGWVCMVWMAGSLAWCGIFVARLARLGRELRLARAASPEIQNSVASAARELRLEWMPRVRVVDGRCGPFVLGLCPWATLWIPGLLWEQLDDERRESILLHELAHLKRGDGWVRLLELLATVLYWWLPVVWLVRKALHEAEEQCCDAWVVRARPAAARSYASALIATLEFLGGASPSAKLASVPVGGSGLGRLTHISRRIEMIMKGHIAPKLTGLSLMFVLTAALVCLPWLPTWARPQANAVAADPAIPQASSDDDAEFQETVLQIKRAQLRKAHALREAAAELLSRMKRLSNSGNASHEDLIEAKAKLSVAEADVEIADAELRQAMLRAERARQAERPSTREARITPNLEPRKDEVGLTQPAQIEARRTPDSDSDSDQETIRKLRQIALAASMYLSQNNAFPPQAIASTDGKPLLSWRVALLPFLEQEELFRKFRLNEPWDSPHNRALIAAMPDVYASRRSEPGKTRFLAVVGDPNQPAVIHFPRSARLEEVTDGTSNSLLVVESAEAVEWTRPEDLTLASNTALTERMRQEGFLAAFADGSVLRIAGGLDARLIAALVTARGGEVIDRQQLVAAENLKPTITATGRLSLPGPAGTRLDVQLPVEAQLDSDQARAMAIAAQVAELIARQLHERGAGVRETTIRQQESEERVRQLESRLRAVLRELDASREAEAAARRAAEQSQAELKRLLESIRPKEEEPEKR